MNEVNISVDQKAKTFEESIKELQQGFVSGKDKNGYQKIEYKIPIADEKLPFLLDLYKGKLHSGNSTATLKCEYKKSTDIEEIFGKGTGILTIGSALLYASPKRRQELEEHIMEIGKYLEKASNEPLQLIRR